MKNVLKVGFLVLVSALVMPAVSSPLSAPEETSVLTPDAAEMKRLENRLEEIKSMDVKSMSRPERKAIKQEVKSIKKKMDSSGGIYLSAGAVILIIVLLIVLL